MSEEATLDEYQSDPETESSQGWQTVKLEDVSRKRSDNVDPQEVDLERHVGLEHIEPNTPYPNWEPLDGLSSTKRRFESGDILFAKLRPNLEKSAQPDFEGVTSTDIFPLIAEQGINSKYLLYILSSKPAYDHSRRTSVGTRMPRTSWNLFSNFEFDLPPLEEQRKIATVLYTLDQAIQKTDEMADQFNEMRTALTHHLLKSGISETNQRQCRIGPKEVDIPSDWDVKKINELSDIKNGNRIVKGHEYAGDATDYPFIRIVDMENGTISSDRVEYLNKKTAEQMQRGIIHSGDVYITVTGRVGDAGTIPDELDGARFTDNAAKLYNLDGVIADYLSLYLRSKFGQDEVHRFTVGSTQPKLSMYRVEKMEVIVPPIEEQRDIVDRVSGVRDGQQANREYSNQLERLKQGLMQDLFSGAVRTHEADIEVPEAVLTHG